jgi:multidrug efflux pump subunit AcrA (membrane-fusion protein)
MIRTAARPLAGLCLGMTVLVACDQAPVETREVVRPVRILTITGLRAGDSLNYPGEIQGVQNAELAFEVSGRLVELPVTEGVTVTRNQLLARLDPSDFQAALTAAEARFRQTKDTFE